MKTKSYCRHYATEHAARDICRIHNRAARLAGNTRDVRAVVEGPDDFWSVVDLRTAIELGCGYTILN